MIKTSPFVLTATLVAVLLASSVANAITVNLNASKDNTLYEDFNGLLSNGAGQHFFAGKNNNDDIRRGLIQFDIASELPSSATISSVTLSMNVSRAAGNQLADAIELKRVIVDWGEAGSDASGNEGGGTTAQSGDATWLHSFSPNTVWGNVGGDFSSIVSASQTVSVPGSYSWSSTQLTDDVQDMLDTENANFGWIVLGRETFSETAKRFDSRESSNPPVLTIEYTTSGGGSDADFDNDGDVDGDDLGDWQTAFGSGSGGDADSDNDSDGADFLVWQQEYTGPAGVQTAVVPEPSSAILTLVFVAIGALNRHNRVSKPSR